jgi:murein DD-endopeptidase MepM/ murein hydrolase activator NlpD
LYQFSDLKAGGGGTAMLGTGRLFAPATPAPAPAFGRRHGRFDHVDLVVDLGVRIGSRHWLRGLVTCTALCATAYLLAPGLEPIAAAAPSPLPDAQWEEARALSIAPLAYGGDTGRRMAPSDAVEPLIDTPERPIVNMVTTMGQGDGFARMLERAGIAASEAAAVAGMVAGVVPLADIRPGTAMDISLGRRPNRQVARPLEALSFRARFDLRLELRREGGRLALTQVPIAIDETPLRIRGQVGSSLYRAARAAGAPAKGVEAYIRAIGTQLNVAELGDEDRFDIILEHRRAATGETETGRLLYAGLDRSGGKDLQLMQWEQGGKAQWFEASGVGRQSGVLTRPVPGNVSSNFGMRRHPILGYSRMHKGMDFRAGYGTPILAVSDGRISAAGWHGGYGKQVRIAHGGGLMTSYSHMSHIAARPGSNVRQGQVIGYVGSTGLSTGPHLHYELYKDGVAINPASVRFVMRSQLAGGELEAFRARLRRLLSVPTGAVRPQETRQAGALQAKPAG